MTIVWGHNHFRLKSVQPHEIGMFDKSYDHISFDLQQKYGHLFWIPIFPMGKMWTINKGDGKKYVCPTELAEQLNQNPGTSSRKSIFAWSGILGVLLIWGGITLSEKYTDNRREKQSAEIFQNEAVSMKDEMAELAPGKYLLLNPKKAGSVLYEVDLIPFKVLNTKADEVLLGSYGSPEDYSSVNISYQSDFIKFLQEKKIVDSFWIGRSVLKESVSQQAGDDDFKGVPFTKYPSYSFRMREIREADPGPLPELGAGDLTSKRDYILNNSGFNARIDSITSYSKKNTGQIEGNRDFKTNAAISVKLSGEGMYKLWLSDKEKHQYVFVLDNTGDALEIKNLEDLPDPRGGESVN